MTDKPKWVGRSVTVLGALLVIATTGGGIAISEETRNILVENVELLLLAAANIAGALTAIYGRIRKKGGRPLTVKPGGTI